MKRNATRILIVVAALLLCAFPVLADTITQNPVATQAFSSFVGQSVTTAAVGGPWDNISFNWYDTNLAPAAYGTLFLLSQEYLGTPAALSSSTTGYIAESVGAGGVYTFAASVTLQPGLQYFFYANAGGEIAHAANINPYPGGDQYGVNPFSGQFVKFDNWDAAFLLQGTPISQGVPEPSSFLLLCSGAVGLLGLRRRKMRV